MTIRSFRDVFEGGQPSASDLNRLFEEVEKLANFGGANASYGVNGIQTAPESPTSFWAKLTSNDAGSPAAHAWTRQAQDAGGTWIDDPQSQSGTTTSFPAYASDGSAMTNGTKVYLYLAAGFDFYVFQAPGTGGGGSTLEVKQSDGGGDTLNVTKIVVDQATGLAVETSASPSVTLKNRDASTSQIGVVNLIDQEFSGIKRFQNGIATAGCSFEDTGLVGQIDGLNLGGTFGVGVFITVAGDPLIGANNVQAGVFPGVSGQVGQYGGFLLQRTPGVASHQPVYAILDSNAAAVKLGITGFGFTSVDTVGGIVVNATGGTSFTSNATDAYSYAGGV